MSSQRDETGTPGDVVTDDPIVIERHDEILTGDVPADQSLGDEGPGEDERGSDLAAGDDLGAGDDSVASDELGAGDDSVASDELAGRPAPPDSGGADPAPLVVPLEAPSPDMGIPAAPSPAAPAQDADSSAAADAPVPADPVTSGGVSAEPVGSGPVPAEPLTSDPAAASPAATSEPTAAWVQPRVAGTPDPAVPGAAGSSDPDRAAGAGDAGVPAAALSGQQWPAIQAMFVDDPQGSVRRAAAAADEAAKAFVASLQREQDALRAVWESDTTTEDLRTALQQYRAFCGRLEGLS